MPGKWKQSLSLGLPLWFVLAVGVEAQTAETGQSQLPASVVTASLAGEQARFTAPAGVAQMRLEVFTAAGEKVFDSDFKSGNLLDWPFQDQQGQPLADGVYRCVITTKDLAGRLAQKRGEVRLQAGTATFENPNDETQTSQESGSSNAVSREAFLAILRDGLTRATTVLVHDGDKGRLVSGSGGLSFRAGDFFAGKDVEQMRLTPEGNLGIGLSNPQARLDVAGMIRASEGIMFPDGTIQTTAANALRRDAGGSDSAKPGTGGSENLAASVLNIRGSGTTNRVTKWLDGPAGVVGDSAITEVGGKVGIGAASPSARLQVESNNTGTALWSISTMANGTAVLGDATGAGAGGTGVRGIAGAGGGVTGGSNSGTGVFGFSSSGAGVRGQSVSGGSTVAGVVGIASGANGNGVLGEANNGNGSVGVLGKSTIGAGVRGESAGGAGVSGTTTTGVAVRGDTGSGVGVLGYSNNNRGVHGESASGAGVYGQSNSGNGVWGKSAVSFGVRGQGAVGVQGESASGHGVVGFNSGGGPGLAGVHGYSSATNGVGVLGSSVSGEAGHFIGKVGITSSLNVDQGSANNGAINPGITFGTSSGEGIASKRTPAGNQFGLDFYTAFSPRLSITQSGDVGIGTSRPEAKLDVVGTTRTHVLQITGGADFAEQFEVKATPEADGDASSLQVHAGLVVSIDPANPGKLVISARAYDRRVAGIISGAGGVKPGMMMSQTGTIADGQHPVALSGRVYCWADASNGPIEPGDLLTTSGIPGHAMKATDHAKAQGAIIGKAMTGLKEGQGLVLTLVTLQ